MDYLTAEEMSKNGMFQGEEYPHIARMVESNAQL